MPDDRIESKLAAYIDGQLSSEETAEVERYLEANPRQRRVVEQMLQARHWLATLPRARAPADLLESIDPTLERSALFADDSGSHSRWRTLVSPQVLALAATLALVVTLLAAMVWLVPQREADLVENPPVVPEQKLPDDDGEANQPGDPDDVDDSPQMPDGVAGVDPTPADPTEGAANPPDGDDDSAPVRPSDGVVAPTLRLPPGAADAVLVSADVASIPEASGAVSQFLTGQDLPFDAQRVAASDLPAELRARLGVSEGKTLFLYIVEQMSLEQVGALTGELTGAGEARALTPPAFAATRAPKPEPADPANQEAPPEGEQAQRIYAEDRLNIQIERLDEPPETTQPGMPKIGRQEVVEVNVSADGYADFGKVGLGRMDVLGKLPADVAEEVRTSLAQGFGIEAKVQASLSTQALPDGGRTREAVQLIYLDREPLVPGDVVQIELPDGSWLHTVVDAEGKVDAGHWGEVAAAGESAVALQEKLRELSAAATQTTRPVDGAATRDAAGDALRVVNLSARRAEGVDSWADTKVSCLVVLSAPAAPATPTTNPDPWAPLLDAATQPATRPVE